MPSLGKISLLSFSKGCTLVDCALLRLRQWIVNNFHFCYCHLFISKETRVHSDPLPLNLAKQLLKLPAPHCFLLYLHLATKQTESATQNENEMFSDRKLKCSVLCRRQDTSWQTQQPVECRKCWNYFFRGRQFFYHRTTCTTWQKKKLNAHPRSQQPSCFNSVYSVMLKLS